MSSITRLALVFAVAVAIFGVLAIAASLAGCTLRVDPQIGTPQIDVGCVIVELGQNTVEMCPDAGGEVAVPSHNIPHPLTDAGVGGQ